MTLQETLQEYLTVIDGIYGVYLDAIKGFISNKKLMEKIQSETSISHNLTIPELDNKAVRFQERGTADPESYILHECTQKMFKNRNEVNGTNFIILGNLCISHIYSYWEDYYRQKIATHNGNKKDDVVSDLFGDLRNFRISIIHNRSIAISEVEKNKVLKWFNRGEKISLTQFDIEKIIDLVRKEIKSFLQSNS